MMLKKNKYINYFAAISLSLSLLFSGSVFAAKSKTSTTTSTSTTTPTTTTILPSSKIVLGFTTYYYSGDKSSYNSMLANTKSINEIATATHTTDSYGNLSGLIPTEQISYANTNKIKPLLMIGNNFSGSTAKTLLENSSNRQNLTNNILNVIKAYNYRGVNIDLEGIYAADRSYYTTFISEVYNKLKPLGYTVTISVPAKTSDSSSATWNYAYDYASLKNYTDQILIMTYDEHYPGGTPGPIASINWVTSVVNYSLTVIPKEKILLGLAAYGYDWYSTTTKAYSVTGCYNLSSTYNVLINWDDVSKSPYFKYIDSSNVSHSVWFENGQSISYKLDLVNQKGLAGVGIWRLGLENSDYWTSINSKFGIK